MVQQIHRKQVSIGRLLSIRVGKKNIISMDELLGISPTYKWASQTSGIEIPNHMAEKLDIFFAADKLTADEYQELIAMLEA